MPRQLKRYEAARKPRAEAIQASSVRNRDALHMPDGPQQRARDAKFARVCAGGENPDRWGDPTEQRFLWGWDAEQSARDALALAPSPSRPLSQL